MSAFTKRCCKFALASWIRDRTRIPNNAKKVIGILLFVLKWLLTFIVTFLSVFYGRTTKGAVDVRSKGLWTYVLRVLGRTSIEPLNELEWEWTKPAWNPLILNSFWTGMNGTEGHGKNGILPVFFRIDWRLNFKKRGNIKNGFWYSELFRPWAINVWSVLSL